MADLGDKDVGRRAENRCQQRGFGVADIELLEVGEGAGAKPALRRLGAEVAVAAAVEGESACGARVFGDYLGDGGGRDA